MFFRWNTISNDRIIVTNISIIEARIGIFDFELGEKAAGKAEIEQGSV